MTEKLTQGKLSKVTASLERAWKTIQTRETDTRDAVIVIYLHPKGDRRGHFAGSSWTIRDDTEDQPELDTLDEVHISSHILAQGARSVLETLLHEAVHSIAAARGIKDTSRQGRWHNKRFETLAKLVGLTVEKSDRIGCTTPDITEETFNLYKETLDDLDQVVGDLYRTAKIKLANTRAKPVKLVCPCCEAKISISVKTLDKIESISCLCGETFEQV